MAIDYEQAKDLLNNSYEKATQELPAAVAQYITDNKDALDTIFSSKTQSYREVLLGCAVARYQDRSCNIRHPYVKQGEDAFNGRTLDEKAVNPFLFSKQIPCSKGPYLATFRRNVTFTEDTRDGLRDKEGFDALLSLISTLEAVSESDEVEAIIIALLKCFIDLREQSIVRLVPIRRLRIDQYRMFLNKLQHRQSGGLIPMLLTDAVFSTINGQMNAGWTIERQEINAADGATGAPGDITIYKDGAIFKAIEVTERPIDGSRVDSTFSTKITLNNAAEYLFVYTNDLPRENALERAKAYFAQGYNINFASITDLTIHILLSGDEAFRTAYNERMFKLFNAQDVQATIKVAWNDALTEAMQA